MAAVKKRINPSRHGLPPYKALQDLCLYVRPLDITGRERAWHSIYPLRTYSLVQGTKENPAPPQLDQTPRGFG